MLSPGKSERAELRRTRTPLLLHWKLGWLGLSLFAWLPLQAQTSPPSEDHQPAAALVDTCGPKAHNGGQSLPGFGSDLLSGTVVDQNGTAVAGAGVGLARQDQSTRQTVSDDDGRFCFANIPPGPFQLTISAEGFATYTSSGTLEAGESKLLPPVTLSLATAFTEVHVGIPPIELAQEQIHEEEQQRVLGFLPNFYVTYIPNAVPLSPRQKFNLAWKTTIDPINFGLNAASAGIQQAANEFGGYGQGAQGYAKRYGASYSDFVISTFIGSAALPSLLKQDPRYFYKGTGSRRSRVLYALVNGVICKGDNGHWQPNYSGIVGGLAAGGISNLYYPPGERGASLVFENTLIGMGTTAAANLLQEFVIRRLTPGQSNHVPANP